MNYLAHAYLSFDQPGILAGNMISDFVKGKKKFEYDASIQKGIGLHRAIDHFTDTHKVTQEAKLFFKPVYGLYSGAFMDVVYDHFLATDLNIFPGNSLEAFAQATYRQLQFFEPRLPERFRQILYYMRTQDWLYHYRFPDGIAKSFAGLVRRAAYMDDPHTAFLIFEENYAGLKTHYENFFPALKEFAFTELTRLTETNA
jgi:acyl carrier protein phosphodiesterase